MLKNKQISFRPIQEYDVRFNRLIFSGLPEAMPGLPQGRDISSVRCPH